MRGEYTVLDRQIQYTMSRHFFSGKYNYNSDLTPSGVLYPREFRIRRYDTCRPIHDRPIHVSTCIYTKGENVTEDRGKRRPRPYVTLDRARSPVRFLQARRFPPPQKVSESLQKLVCTHSPPPDACTASNKNYTSKRRIFLGFLRIRTTPGHGSPGES